MKKMRIGVLEWASCGGMDGSAELSDTIRIEGWAMCRSALVSLARAGHQAVALVDASCAIDPLVSSYRIERLELVKRTAREPVWPQWQRLYTSCDYTLVIAPECDRILERLLGWCQEKNVRPCNCGNSFVRRASDKLRTAKFFEAHAVPHPPTQLLSDAQRQWMAAAASQPPPVACSPEPTWVIKPRDGVGCDGTMRATAAELRNSGGFAGRVAFAERAELGQLNLRRWIVQPWLPGEAYSRSAIVDRSGQLHWLPVTRQHLSIGERVAYLGGSVEPELAGRIPELDQVLTRAVRALGGRPRGWVGIDFLYDESNAQQPVTIIEINPRLTTSFVGLTSAGAPNLAAAIVAAACGEPVELPSQWQKVRFTAAGATEPI